MKRLLVKGLKSTFISQNKIKTKNKKIKALITNNRHLKMNHSGHNVYVSMQQHMFVAYFALFTAKKIVNILYHKRFYILSYML